MVGNKKLLNFMHLSIVATLIFASLFIIFATVDYRRTYLERYSLAQQALMNILVREVEPTDVVLVDRNVISDVVIYALTKEKIMVSALQNVDIDKVVYLNKMRNIFIITSQTYFPSFSATINALNFRRIGYVRSEEDVLLIYKLNGSNVVTATTEPMESSLRLTGIILYPEVLKGFIVYNKYFALVIPSVNNSDVTLLKFYIFYRGFSHIGTHTLPEVKGLNLSISLWNNALQRFAPWTFGQTFFFENYGVVKLLWYNSTYSFEYLLTIYADLPVLDLRISSKHKYMLHLSFKTFRYKLYASTIGIETPRNVHIPGLLKFEDKLEKKIYEIFPTNDQYYIILGNVKSPLIFFVGYDPPPSKVKLNMSKGTYSLTYDEESAHLLIGFLLTELSDLNLNGILDFIEENPPFNYRTYWNNNLTVLSIFKKISFPP